MKRYIFILALLTTVNGIAQERKIRLALGLSDSFLHTITNVYEYYTLYDDLPQHDKYSAASNSWYNITSLGLGLNIRMKHGNMSIYGAYSLKGYVGFVKSVKKYEFHNHLLGIAIEYNLFSEAKRFRPYIHCSLQTEIYPSYKDRYINKYFLYPFNSSAYPFLGWITSGHNFPGIEVYGSKFYQNTPIMFGISAGYSMRIFNGFQLNASFGYNLTRWNLKYVRWMNATELAEKLPKAPILHYSLHSMAFQLGLSYAFDIHKKKQKAEMP